MVVVYAYEAYRAVHGRRAWHLAALQVGAPRRGASGIACPAHGCCSPARSSAGTRGQPLAAGSWGLPLHPASWQSGAGASQNH